jgi:pyridoxal phosphate enzyme (YggS family)
VSAPGAPVAPAELEAAAARLAAVQARIESACRRSGRDPGQVTVVGACKRQPLHRIAAAVLAGVGELGANYVQEARDVQPALEALLEPHRVAPPRWRMIGHLQRNKVRTAVGLFDAIDTVDRAAVAEEIEKRAAPLGRTIDVCLQIDLSGESTKSGAPAEAARGLLEACAALPHVRVVGLMTMPAADPERARAAFARLRGLRDTLREAPGGECLDVLSMGMSGDLETAVEEGATHVRIGTALFGERAPAGAGR